ncbi:MAG: DNA polymerase I, partial [uncultured Gemmatimonadetes bacterium]
VLRALPGRAPLPGRADRVRPHARLRGNHHGPPPLHPRDHLAQLQRAGIRRARGHQRPHPGLVRGPDQDRHDPHPRRPEARLGRRPHAPPGARRAPLRGPARQRRHAPGPRPRPHGKRDAAERPPARGERNGDELAGDEV